MKDTQRLGGMVLAAVVALWLAGQTPSAQAPAGSRTVVMVADLHMGIGRDGAGKWSPLEDFRWTTEFAAFLKAVDADGKSATDLVLNGDTFELLQSAEQDCVNPDPSLGCTEAEAVKRLERVLAAHASEMAALSAFAGAGSNRVVFVPGDHDAALLFPAVRTRLLAAVKAPAGRVDVSSGFYLSGDGRVYAEHGHQIGFSGSKFEGWPAPFVQRSGQQYLSRPWGEQVVQTLFNRVESKYPAVDNIVQEGIGAKYAISAEGTTDAGEAAPQWVRFFLSKTPWQQFRNDLDQGNPDRPVWDVAKIRADGPGFLVASLPGDDLFRPLAEKALADGRLSQALSSLTDFEISTICDYRAAVRRSRRRNEGGLSQNVRFTTTPLGPECPRTADTRGSGFEYFWGARDDALRQRLAAVRPTLPQAGKSIGLFVYAHMHMSDRGANELHSVAMGVPLDDQADGLIGLMVGPWQRTITPAALEQMRGQPPKSDDELLRAIDPDRLNACYSFVKIGYENGVPSPILRAWRQDRSGAWAMAGGCGGGG